MATIVINGKTYSGNSVSIVGGRVTIDGRQAGVDADSSAPAPEVSVAVTGNLEKLHVDVGTVRVQGNVGTVNTTTGNVTVGEGGVGGDVRTMSGDVECAGAIKGNVSTMSGNVRRGAECPSCDIHKQQRDGMASMGVVLDGLRAEVTEVTAAAAARYLAERDEWKARAEKAGADAEAFLNGAEEASIQRDEWKARAERAEAALSAAGLVGMTFTLPVSGKSDG